MIDKYSDIQTPASCRNWYESEEYIENDSRKMRRRIDYYASDESRQGYYAHAEKRGL